MITDNEIFVILFLALVAAVLASRLGLSLYS